MFSGWICMPLTAAAASTPCSRVSQLQPWAGRLETSESFDMLAGKSLQGYTWFLPNGSISAWIRSVCISINNFLHMFYINRHNCMCHMHGFTSIQLTLFFQQRLPGVNFKSWIKPRKLFKFLAKSASNPSKTWRFLEFLEKMNNVVSFLKVFNWCQKRLKIREIIT